MSKTIDEKVVQMEFDNSNFESNVKTTMNTLSSLKESLNFDKSAKSLENVGAAANNVSLDDLISGIEESTSKFSALEVIAISALATIVSKATEAGLLLVKELSLDQIAAGWDRYAEKTQAVQTIMAATGDSVEQVSEKLERLNWFTDETSYNFSDMVSNIGKFTANQVPLDEAIRSMEGIANWAAISGQNTMAASRAMYNLSQALGVGHVMIRDWMSIENANMATADFKQTVMDTAVEIGTLKKVGDQYLTTAKNTEVTVANFRSTLNEAWFDTDVLTSVLGKYGIFADKLYDTIQVLNESAEGVDITASVLLSAIDKYDGSTASIEAIAVREGVSVDKLQEAMEALGDETLEFGKKAFKAAQEAKTFQEAIDATKDAVRSRWMEIFEIIFGNYEQAKVLWTDLANYLYDIFTDRLWAIEDVLAKWSEKSGRDILLKGLYNIGDAIETIIGLVKEASAEIFPFLSTETAMAEENSKVVLKLTENFTKFTEEVKKYLDVNGENIKNTLKGIFAVLDIGLTLIKSVIGVIKEVLSHIIPLTNNIWDLTGSIGEFLVSLDESIKKSKVLNGIFEGLGKILSTVVDLIKSFFDAFSNPNMVKITSFGDVLNGVSKFMSKIADGLKTVEPLMSKLGELLASIFKYLKEIAIKFKDNLSFDDILNVFKTGFLGISAFQASKGFQWIGDGLYYVGSALGEFLLNFERGAPIKAMLKFSIAILMLSTSLSLLASLDTSKLVEALSSILLLIRELYLLMLPSGEMLKGLTSFKGVLLNFLNTQSISKIGTILIKFASAIGILAIALHILNKVDSDKLWSSILALNSLMASLLIISGLLSKMKAPLVKGSTGLILFATALVILTSAIKILGDMHQEDMIEGLIAVIALIFQLAIVSMALKATESTLIKGSVGLIAFAASLVIMAEAIKILGDLTLIDLAKGVAAFSAVLWEIYGVSALLSKNEYSMMKGSVGLIAFATSMVIMAQSIKTLSGLGLISLAEGVAAFSAVLWEIYGISALLSKNEYSMMKGSVGLIAFAASMVIVAQSIKTLSGLGLISLAEGVAAFSAVLWEIYGISALLNKNKFSTGELAGNLLIFSVAMELITNALTKLGSMPLTQIGIALGSLTIILVELISSIAVLKLALKDADVLAMSVAITSFAIALNLLLIPLTVFSTFKWYEAAIAVGVFTGVLGAMVGAVYLLKGAQTILLGLSATMVSFSLACVATGAGILAIGLGIAAIVLSIKATGQTIVSLLVEFVSLIPRLFEQIAEGLISFARIIAEGFPTIFTAITEFLVGIIDLVVGLMPRIWKAVIDSINSLVESMPQLVEAIVKLLVAMFDTLSTKIPELMASLGRFVQALFNGFVEAFKGIDLSSLVDALLELAVTALVLAGVGKIGTSALQGLGILMAIIAGIGLLIAGLGLLVEAVPTLETVLRKGIPLLNAIGEGIGSFVGGLVGGLLSGLTDGLIKTADNLSAFMIHLEPFLNGCKSITSQVAKGVLNLSEAIIILTASNLLNAITSFFLGSSSFSKFGDDLSKFGPKFKQFADSVNGLDADVVENAAKAGKAIAEMAKALPNTGGVAGFFAGENDMSIITDQLVPFGEALKKYSIAVDGLDANVVKNSAIAGKALAEMAKELPNTGGLTGFFAGENGLAEFTIKLIPFGKAMSGFADIAANVNPGTVTAAANAGKALAEMAATIPNAGGIISWFAGENDMTEFTNKLVPFGEAIAEFSAVVSGKIDETSVSSAANAGKLLAEMADTIPNAGGVAAWFAGENDMTKFTENLKPFGEAIAEFSGIVSGKIDSESVAAASNAGKLLAEMMGTLPKENGAFEWFTGTLDVEGFNKNLKPFGEAIAEFSGIVSGKIDGTSVEAATNAGKTLAEMLDSLPRENGALEWFTGTLDVDSFTEKLVPFGEAIAEFSSIVSGNIDGASVEAASNAGKTLAEMIAALPKEDGILEWFTGTLDVDSFTEKLPTFGTALTDYSKNVMGFNKPLVDSTIDALKQIIDIIKSVKEIKSNTIDGFTSCLENLGNIGISKITSAFNDSHDKIVTAINDFLQAGIDGTYSFDGKFKEKGNIHITNYMDAFKQKSSNARATLRSILNTLINQLSSARNDFYKNGQNSMQDYLKGIVDKSKEVESAMIWAGRDFVKYLRDGSAGSYQVGWDFTEGFIQGMESLAYAANWSAWTIGHNAIGYLRSGTVSNSPSKAAREIGGFVGDGFILGMIDKIKDVNSVAYDLGDESINALADALNKASQYASDTMELDPVIRPVLDLSEIQNGVNGLNGMFGDYQLGSVSGRLASSISLGGNVDQTIPVYNDSNVLVAIDTLGSRVDSLNDAISKMRVVLDSGEVVGGISNKMNKRFGEMEFAVARGVR